MIILYRQLYNASEGEGKNRMHSILTVIGTFFLMSVFMSAASETAAGLLISANKAFFITPEEEVLLKIQKAVLEKELEEEAEEMDMTMPGYREKINAYFKWAGENEVLNIFVLYLLCIIPIVNIAVFFNNIRRIIKLFIVKFKIIVHRFKQM